MEGGCHNICYFLPAQQPCLLPLEEELLLPHSQSSWFKWDWSPWLWGEAYHPGLWPSVYTTPLARMVHWRMAQDPSLFNEHEPWKSEWEMIHDEIIWVTLNSGLTLDSLGSYVSILFCLSSGTWSNQSVCLSQFELGFFYLQPRQPWLTR